MIHIYVYGHTQKSLERYVKMSAVYHCIPIGVAMIKKTENNKAGAIAKSTRAILIPQEKDKQFPIGLLIWQLSATHTTYLKSCNNFFNNFKPHDPQAQTTCGKHGDFTIPFLSNYSLKINNPYSELLCNMQIEEKTVLFWFSNLMLW